MGFDNVITDLSTGSYSQALTDQVGGGIPLWIVLALALGMFWLMSPTPKTRRRV